METGMFLLPLIAGTGKMGAISINFNLGVSTPNRKVGGVARAFQSTNPPLDVHFDVNGDFTYMTVMPQNTHILVVLEGNNEFKGRIVLESNWQSGTGSFSFIDNSGKQHGLENVPVKLAQVNQPQAAKAN